MAIKICVFGSSVAQGYFDKEKGGWVNRLKIHLMGKDKLVYNFSISGQATNKLLKRIKPELTGVYFYDKRDTILFEVGQNDSNYEEIPGNYEVKPKEFKKNLGALLTLAKQNVKNIIFIGPTPIDNSKTMPFWRNHYHTNEASGEYNNMIKDFCKTNKVQFINIFDEWNALDYKTLLHDGIHPNEKGHRIIFETVKEFLEKKKLI